MIFLMIHKSWFMIPFFFFDAICSCFSRWNASTYAFFYHFQMNSRANFQFPVKITLSKLSCLASQSQCNISLSINAENVNERMVEYQIMEKIDSYIVYLTIWYQLFSSSEWSALDFLLTHVTNMLQLASSL